MEELPERKLLKEVLSDTKAKTLRSKSSAEQSAKALVVFLEKMWKVAYEKHESDKDIIPDGPARLVLTYTRQIQNMVSDLIKAYQRASDDDFTYIKWLEKYSMDLDKTLYDAIEAGTKKAQEQTEKQNELLGKEKDDYVD